MNKSCLRGVLEKAHENAYYDESVHGSQSYFETQICVFLDSIFHEPLELPAGAWSLLWTPLPLSLFMEGFLVKHAHVCSDVTLKRPPLICSAGSLCLSL